MPTDRCYPDGAASAEAVRISVYDNAIPPFVAGELERLYQNIYSTLARLALYDDLRHACTYVEHTRGGISALLLFRLQGDVIHVLNQQVPISARTIARFTDCLFGRYKFIRSISFYAIDFTPGRLRFPYQVFRTLEENVLTLPATADQYIAGLGQRFRRSLRNGGKELRQRIPSFDFRIYAGAEANEEAIRDIIGLTGARMAAKQKSAYVRQDEILKIIDLVRTYGYVGVATVEGRVAAGIIWYGVGQRFFMHIVAHDPQYDEHMLGNHVLLLAVCESIAQGGRECWMMGGGRENKRRFRAAPRYLDSVLIYRSRLAYLRAWRSVSVRAATGLARAARERLEAVAQGGSRAARPAVAVLTVVRAIKRRAFPSAWPQ